MNGGVAVKYELADLSPEQFEKLVVFFCQELLGIGVESFASGRDGGRDARFTGKCERFPSSASPWEGCVVIQAKHVERAYASFSDGDFQKIVREETPKIKKLYKGGELTHYMLFSNRRAPAVTVTKLRENIALETGLSVDRVRLIGLEDLENYGKRFPDALVQAGIRPFDRVFHYDPEILARVFEAFLAQRDQIIGTLDNFQEETSESFQRVEFDKKNAYNNFSPDIAEEFRKNFMSETTVIENFLSNPANEAIADSYHDIIYDLKTKILIHRSEFDAFEKVLERISDILAQQDIVFRQNKRLTSAILFYMYWNCDISQSEPVKAQEAVGKTNENPPLQKGLSQED